MWINIFNIYIYIYIIVRYKYIYIYIYFFAKTPMCIYANRQSLCPHAHVNLNIYDIYIYIFIYLWTIPNIVKKIYIYYTNINA